MATADYALSNRRLLEDALRAQRRYSLRLGIVLVVVAGLVGAVAAAGVVRPVVGGVVGALLLRNQPTLTI